MSEKITFKKAITSSPGPKTKKEAITLYLKGFLMGSADIVPGVSGGTIAFITGIYEKLLLAIKSLDFEVLRLLLSLKIAEALQKIHLRFLVILFLGIISALLSLAHLISYILLSYPSYLWSVFFGLIVASVFLIGTKIEKIAGRNFICLLFGTVFSFFMVGMIPLSTPETYLFVFLSGVLAISAMILPGLSGAFILLVLGKYEFMINALKNPFEGSNFLIVLVFVFGCLIGILCFSRVVSYLLKKHYNATVAFLAGMVIGSLRKVWPWKEVVEERVVAGHSFVLRENNIIPELDLVFMIQVSLAIFAFMLPILIEKKARN